LLIIRSIKKYFSGQIILHIHYSDFKQILFDNIVLNKLIVAIINKSVDKIILLSNRIINNFTKLGIKSKINILYNYHMYSKLNYDFYYNKNKINILYLGSIDKRKGLLDIIYALTQVNKSKYIFNIAGEATHEVVRKKVDGLIKEYNMENNIYFCGYVQGKEKQELLEKSDVLMLPSYGEGLPVAILEAMATGNAIIASHVGSIPEIILHNENGFLVTPGNVDEIRNYINVLIEDNHLLNRIKQNNVLRSSDFSIEHFIDNLEHIYRSA
jgi:glycosyltransferase involved in cell wall biosynthesis